MTSDPLRFDQYQVDTDGSNRPVILSSDGTGVTYRAKDLQTNRSVLLRVFGDQLLGNTTIQKDFVDRARLLIELDHPNITRITDTGQDGNQFFYVLQDPGGETLDAMVKKRPLSVNLALRLQLQIVDALMAVRSQPRLLSRVWPRNLIVNAANAEHPKIWLIAQNLLDPLDPLEMPECLAPEVLSGGGDTVQATLYSIGATLYFMLTGQPPHPPQASVEELLQLKRRLTPDFAALPPGSPVTLLSQLLEIDPKARPKSLLEWDKSLQRFIRFTPQDAGEAGATGFAVGQTPNPAMAHPGAVSPMPSPEAASELARAQAHTQRLGLELTRRVQKELALTEQLKALEAELERERRNAESLRQGQTAVVGEKPQDMVAQQVKELEKARKALEEEKKSLLEKTQRLSLRELELEKEKKSFLEATGRVYVKPRPSPASEDPSPASEEPAPTSGEQTSRPKKRGFWSRWSTPPAPPAIAEASPAELETKPAQTQDTGATKVAEPVSPAPALKPAKSLITPDTRPAAKPVAEAPAELKPAHAPTVAPAPVPEPEPSPAPAEAPKPEAGAFPTPASAIPAIAKPITTPTPVAMAPPSEAEPRAVDTPKPLPKTPTAGAPPPAIGVTPKPSTAALAEKPPEPPAPRPIQTPPAESLDYAPVRAAWAALVILALIFGFMLLRVYQTFFRQTPGPVGSSLVTPPPAVGPRSLGRQEPPVNRERAVNDKIKLGLVEMEKEENRKLVQEEDWKGLALRIRLLRKNWEGGASGGKDLRYVEADLLESMKARAKAKKTPDLDRNEDFRQLLEDLAARVDAGPAN